MNILITGPAACGKTTLARAIHTLASSRGLELTVATVLRRGGKTQWKSLLVFNETQLDRMSEYDLVVVLCPTDAAYRAAIDDDFPAIGTSPSQVTMAIRPTQKMDEASIAAFHQAQAAAVIRMLQAIVSKGAS